MTKVIQVYLRATHLQYFKVINSGLPFRLKMSNSLVGKGSSGIHYTCCHISYAQSAAEPNERDAVTCMFILVLCGQKVVDVQAAFALQLYFSNNYIFTPD